MTAALTDEQALLLRLRAQRLAPPQPDTVVEAVRALCGLQAQSMSAVPLAVRVRSVDLRAADVQRARLEERSVVRTWAMRSTLHLLAAEDLGWLLPLLAPMSIAASRRRSAELGLDEDMYARGVRAIRDALVSRGPLTRPELVEYLDRRGVRTEGQAKAYVMYRAALEGFTCFGPDRGVQPTYVLLDDWIPEKRRVALPREEACAELALRYLAAYGPAVPEDLAAWSGLALSEARAAWGRLADELLEVEAGRFSSPAWMLKAHAAWLDELSASSQVVRLLPAFDTYLLGYRNRSLALAPEYAKRVNAGGGMIAATLLVNGRIVGTWKSQRRRNTLEVVVEPFQPLAPEVLPGLEAEIGDLARFLGTAATLEVLPPLAQ